MLWSFNTQEKPKMFSKDQDITHEAVNKKLAEIISARGKKGTDRNTQIELLTGSPKFVYLEILAVAIVFDMISTASACSLLQN